MINRLNLMKTPLLFALAAAVTLTATGAQPSPIRIVTSIPDLAEFAGHIGGPLVQVRSLATGVEDPHGLPIKPSFVTQLARADAVILLGLENEHAYLPALLEASRNNRIQPGRPGYIDTSVGIVPMEVPTTLDRAQGEVHPAGNPHYNLDPVHARTILNNICDSLSRLFPEHAQAFEQGRDAYLAQLDARITAWLDLAAPARGLKFVSYHAHWAYFADRFGFNHIGTIEMRPGIEPTPRHVQSLVELMKEQDVRIVVREPQYSPRLPSQIARQTGATVVTLPIMVGGVRQANTYIGMIDYNLRTLLDAAR
jgi:zinc/manganese transport system substrate-binding protein